MAIDPITDEQKKGGTYRERFLQLKKEFDELLSAGATAQTCEEIFLNVLKQMEDLRIENERQARKYEQQLAQCQALAKACTTYSNLLVSVVSFYRRQFKSGALTSQTPPPSDIPHDTDVLKTICVCGCQDAEDAKDCSCICHTKGACDRPDCEYCRQKKSNSKPTRSLDTTKVPRKRKTTKKVKKVS